jgi:hypothetical protein
MIVRTQRTLLCGKRQRKVRRRQKSCTKRLTADATLLRRFMTSSSCDEADCVLGFIVIAGVSSWCGCNVSNASLEPATDSGAHAMRTLRRLASASESLTVAFEHRDRQAKRLNRTTRSTPSALCTVACSMTPILSDGAQRVNEFALRISES